VNQNPDAAKNQVEGGIVDGIGHAMYSALSFKNGIAEQSNFDKYRLIRHSEAPAEIETNAFWPVVSPDGNFLAVQAVNWETLSDNPQPRLEFYSLLEKNNPKKLELTLDLSAFDQERMFVTDWRK